MKYVFVGCSAHYGTRTDIVSNVKEVALRLAKRGYNLSFGACEDGLMGEVYRVFREENRKVIGISLANYEESIHFANNKEKCDQCFHATNVYDRVVLALENSDMLVFLPGSTGTLHELITAMEIKRISRDKYEQKPIIIIDEGAKYYSDLISFLNGIESNGFSHNYNLYKYITNIFEFESLLDSPMLQVASF